MKLVKRSRSLSSKFFVEVAMASLKPFGCGTGLRLIKKSPVKIQICSDVLKQNKLGFLAIFS